MPDYTSTTSMPAWAQPYAEGYLQQAHQVSNQPYQGYGGDRVAGFTPWQEQGYGAMAQRAADGSPLLGGAQQALQGMWGQPQQGATQNPYGQVQAGMNGSQVMPGTNQYAGSNPYLTQQIDQAQGDVVRNWNQVQMPGFDTAMSRSGSFGNANVIGMASQGASDLQRNLGEISGRMRFQDYGNQQQLAENAVTRGMDAQKFNAGLTDSNLGRQFQASQINANMGNDWASRNDAMYAGGQGRLLQALGLAPSMAQADYNDIDRLTQAGGAYQNTNQRQLDDAYSRFSEQRGNPQQQLDAFGRALGTFNPGSTKTETGPGQNPLATAAGGALTAAQLWKLLMGGP